ncbi:MAG: hypothetical protein BRD52_02245 [Bacteroidetes bacterium SW_4_67_19]|jgi:hypothetical protein|nr:MAG: hypothetical protein BRD52_02245 [Bacteroidetes bacterium SW_4_67_19]
MLPSNPSKTTDRARALSREWHAAQTRKAASASGVFGGAPVDGTALNERTLYLLIMLLPLLLSFFL